MKKTTITVNEYARTLVLGRQGENQARTIIFDVARWVQDYGAGVAILYHQRNGDSAPYLISLVETDTEAGTITWVVSNVDVAAAGTGQLQVLWYVDDVLAKSAIFQTVTRASLNSDDAPDAYDTWLDTLSEKAAETLVNVAAAQTAQESAEAAATAAAGSADESAQSAEAAAQSAANAAESEKNAATSEINAQKYAELASEEAASNGYFYVEGVDGYLYYVHTDNVEDFTLQDDGKGVLEAVYGSTES